MTSLCQENHHDLLWDMKGPIMVPFTGQGQSGTSAMYCAMLRQNLQSEILRERGKKIMFLAAPWQFMSTCRGLSGVGSVTATVWTTFTTTLPLWSGRMRLSHLWSTYTESVLPQVHLWWWGKGTWTLEQPKSCFFKGMEEVSAMIQEVHRPAGRLCGEVI